MPYVDKTDPIAGKKYSDYALNKELKENLIFICDRMDKVTNPPEFARCLTSILKHTARLIHLMIQFSEQVVSQLNDEKITSADVKDIILHELCSNIETMIEQADEVRKNMKE